MSKEVISPDDLDYGGRTWKLGTVKEVYPTAIRQLTMTVGLCDHGTLEHNRSDQVRV